MRDEFMIETIDEPREERDLAVEDETSAPEMNTAQATGNELQQISDVSVPVSAGKSAAKEEPARETETYFGPKRSDWERMRAMFSGADPYAVIADPEMKEDLKKTVRLMLDPAAEERKIAVAAYMSRMKRKNIGFVYENLDGVLNAYYGRETKVDEAFKDISGMLLGAREQEKDGLVTRTAKGVAAGTAVAAKTFYGFLAQMGKMMQAQNQADLLARGIDPDKYLKSPEEVEKQVLDFYQAHYGETEEWLREGSQVPEDWMTNSESFGDWCGNAVVSLIGYMPELGVQMGVTMMGGLPALGVMYGLNKYTDLKMQNPEMDERMRLLNAAGTGTVNAVMEKVTLGIIDGKITKKWAVDGIKAGFLRASGYFGWSMTKEAAEEAAEQLAENLIDIYSGVYGDYKAFTPEEWKQHLKRGVCESAFLGGVTGGAMAAGPYLSYRALDQFGQEARNSLQGRERELLQKEDLTENETAELRHIQTTLETGNINQAVGLSQEVAQTQEAKRRADAEAAVERDAEMTSEERADAARQDYQLRRSMAHNPEDTADAVAETGAGYKVNVRACGTAEIASMETGRNAEEIRAFYDPETDTVVVNTDRVRPSEVPYLFLHEVAVHKGLDAVFGESRKNAVLDGLYGQMHEQIEAVNTGYGFDLDTTEGRRAATEEYLAECAEFCGHDWRKFDRENEEDVTRWLAEHNMALMRRKEGVRGVLEERGELSVRPAWWREFLQKVKMFFYGFKGFSNYRFTDKEIETLLLRGYRKTRNARGAKAEGGDARFAALRREGAPNTAEESGQMRDSRVPHEEGFMEKYKFSGKGLYADYEFLYGRHPEYFEDAEHVRAAVEFVLAQPEEAVDVEGNAAFVRRDEETGTPYRIEIEKTTRAKYNHIRSVHVLSEQQYEKAKAGATPANAASPVLQPSQNRVRQTDTNGDLTGRQGRTVSDFLRYDSTESGKVKHSPEGGARFSIIGEEGAGRGREAEARMNDLRIAREMETAGKDAKTIKRATGWERGGDGKWRMEIPDLKIKREETLPDGTTYAKSEFSLKFHDGTLGEYVDAPELFEAYPELRNIRLAVRPEEMSDTGFSYGYFDKSRNMIVVYSDVPHAEELLVHEVQHAIQAQEGFPGGGDGRTGAEYRKLAGEVEAYNAAKRRKMTAEEKRESLLEESADVAEEDKIYLNGADGPEHSFAYADRYTLENAKASKEGYRVERVNENAGRDLTEAQGVVCEINQVFNPEEAARNKGNFFGWATKKLIAYEKAHPMRGSYYTPALGNSVEIAKSSLKSLGNHPGENAKYNLLPAVPDMLKNAVLIQSEANIDKNTQSVRSHSHLLAAKVRYGKDDRYVAIMVIREGNGKLYYDHSLLILKEESLGREMAAENGNPAQTAGSSSHTAQVLKVAREALLSSGFDTKNEKNLRFSIEQYSDADWSDMVTYMKAKVGDLLTKSDAEYKKMLEDAGMECYSEADAHACAVEAMNANLKDAQARRKAEMMKWIVENNTWIQRIAEVTGSPEFKIRPSYRFQGMNFTGSYISREWRDCSGNPKAKNREKRLREASGYHSDELAQMIADKFGGDAIEIENDLIEYFQHKKKKASKTERENGELGVYDEYYAFKKEERLFNRELDRQMQEQWESQEAVRVGDEIKSILEEKRVIGEELAETDFDLFASLYQQVTGERAPAHPSAEQLDALNAVIQEGGVTQAYIRGWEAGRDRMLAEKRKEFAEFTAKVMQEKAAMKEHYKERIAKEREKRREQAEKFETERANIRESNLERLEERARENARELQLQREANLERQEEMVRDDADKLYLQRQAEEFAKKNVPAEQRGEFIRGIVDLAKYSYLPTKKYPSGQRKAKLQELFERMAARGEEVRKERLVAEVEKLFKQAGLRADSGRKQRNVLSFDVQRVVDRCREYANLSAAETETLSSELAQQIDNTELTGNALADLEYEARLLDLFGNYRGKSASEIELARAELKTLVNTGRSELKQEIRERVQADGLARSDITAGLLNGENPLTPQQRRALEAKRKREKTKRVLAETNWKSNSLDSLLSYLELPSGGKVETVEELQRKLYRSNDSKMTRNRKHAEELEAKLNEFCGVDPAKRDSFTARKARAELIRKWRERPEKTGIIRGQPNEMTQYMKWVRVPADQAQAKLKEFQAQGREVEAAALEHLLNTERLRIKRGDVTSGDAVTDALVKEMRKMQDADQEKAYFIPELRLGANPVEEKLTQLEALYMRLMWGQKNVKYKMRFNGWTEMSMKQIDAYLKPEVKEFGEWMVKQLERDRADIEAVYEKLYFSMFPHEENYFPSVYNPTRETMTGQVTTDLSQEGGNQTMAYTPGGVKLRAFHLMEPKICDALNVFVNHRTQMDHFVTHGETARELRSVFANKDVAQTIRDIYGGEYYDQLKKEILDFIHGGNAEVQNTQFAQTALNNFTRMKMLWNLVSAGKQVFGGVSYFAFSGVPAKAMASGIADFWKHPVENAKNLRETEYFKNRWQGGMNREMKAIMDSTGLCAGNMQLFMRELDYAGFMLMRAGDAFPVLVYGHAIYKYHYEQLVKQGMAPHEADVKAKEEWALATERTQQSGAPHMLNSWQKGNFAQKALVSFLSNPTLLFQSYSRDIYSQKRFGHGGWSAAKKIAVAGICSVLMSAINQMIRNGDDWDEYSLSDAVFSVLNDITVGWVGVGTLMSGIYDALSYGRAKTIPVLDDAGRAVRSGYRIAGEMAEGDLNEENLRDAIALLQGLGLFWSPAAQVSALGREGRRWWQFFTGEKKK